MWGLYEHPSLKIKCSPFSYYSLGRAQMQSASAQPFSEPNLQGSAEKCLWYKTGMLRVLELNCLSYLVLRIPEATNSSVATHQKMGSTDTLLISDTYSDSICSYTKLLLYMSVCWRQSLKPDFIKVCYFVAVLFCSSTTTYFAENQEAFEMYFHLKWY